jgi:hypothetical protein
MNTLLVTNSRWFFALITAILMIAVTPLSSQSAETKQDPEAEAKTVSPVAPTKKKGVYVGMPAEELQAAIGKPEQIIPVPSKSANDGHSEIWVYRRFLRSYIEVMTVGSRPIMGRRQNGDGSWSDVVLSTEPVDKNRRTDVYQVARFLITDGKYVANAKFEEKEQTFQ